MPVRLMVFGTVTLPALAVAQAQEAPTPMAEREAHFVLLDTVNGERQELRLKPGGSTQYEGLQIRLQACEKRPPWQPPEAAAFVQIDQQAANPVQQAERLYSGWMLARARSVNPFQHPRYELWLTECVRSYPATGPDTTVID